MQPKRRIRKTNPVIFVFCEGETEKQYVDMLRVHFRMQIQIISKILRTKISQRLIDASIKSSGYPEVDQIFLFYDGDRPDIVEKLNNIKNAHLMLSCPCVELWFLLHFIEHRKFITTENAENLLSRHFPTYKKGLINSQLAATLLSSWETAAQRAKSLPPMTNPSTTAYILPEFLKTIKSQ